MPSCRPDIIPAVLYRVMEMKPSTILDIGAGHGKWGVLCTEYLRYWCDIIPEVDGVEVFSEYAPGAHSAYRKMFYENIMDKLDIVEDYDLVLIIDVIEHLSREEGRQLLDKVKKHYIVSTPSYWSAQGASFGNIHETHVSRWTEDDFANSTLVGDATGRYHILGWQ